MLKGNLSCRLCRLLPGDAPLFADGLHSWDRRMLFMVSGSFRHAFSQLTLLAKDGGSDASSCTSGVVARNDAMQTCSL